VIDGSRPAPDLVVLDLAFPMESGFEVLRRWRAHPKLRDIRIIVWTAMGETEQCLSEYFGVQKVVPKWAGPKELEQGESFGHECRIAILIALRRFFQGAAAALRSKCSRRAGRYFSTLNTAGFRLTI
jgi:CheY-like chemotaxis protein